MVNSICCKSANVHWTG